MLQTVALVLLVLWAIYHSFLDYRQDQRLDRLEKAQKLE